MLTTLESRTHDTPTSAKAIVEVKHLSKVFPKRQKGKGRLGFLRHHKAEPFVAVDGVSFDIREGEIFGLLGPNGAGKTTTIRMLSTLLEPSSGSVRVGGYDTQREPGAVRQILGAVLTGERSIYWKLSGRENLEYFAALYHLPPKIAKARVEELLTRLNLEARADEYVERYSSGMKQRIGIAKALLANPPVLLLDEPTVGLDPQSARNLRELILDIKAEGRTVLLTTHYMEEADLLCDRIGIVDSGKVIALGTPAELKRQIAQRDILTLELTDFAPALGAALRAHPGVEEVIVHTNPDGSTLVTLHALSGRDLLPDVLERLAKSGSRLRHVSLSEPTLEDVFIALTGKGLRE